MVMEPVPPTKKRARRVIISLLALPPGPFNCCKTHSLGGVADHKGAKETPASDTHTKCSRESSTSNDRRVCFSAHCCCDAEIESQLQQVHEIRTLIEIDLLGCLMRGRGSITTGTLQSAAKKIVIIG
jgi:hypothetical protein